MMTDGVGQEDTVGKAPTRFQQMGNKDSRLSVIVHKWRHYSRRYGRLSAILRYIGRCYPRVWSLFGGIATTSYLKWWKRQPGTKLLNLGGGGNLNEEWLTADVDPRADVFVDCGETLPFANGTVDGIMLEEVIEHLDYLRGLKLLKECNRILKGNGILRVSTPDVMWFAELQIRPMLSNAQEAKEDFVYRECCRLLGTNDAPDELIRAAALNSIFFFHGHRFVYTSQSLEKLFCLAGFEFRRSTYREANSKLARLDTHPERFRHPPEISLYYDAWKKA